MVERMRPLRWIVSGLASWAAAALLAGDNLSAAERGPVPPAGAVQNFSLRDEHGIARELYTQTNSKALVLIFTTTGCPIVQKSVPTIKRLRDEFSPRGVLFWFINSNPDDDPGAVTEEAKDFKIDLPILLDHTQSVARGLAATRTAEVFCIEPKTWTVFYRGAIDDRLGYGSEKPRAGHPFLKDALKNFLAGKKVAPARTEVKGCLIQFVGR